MILEAKMYQRLIEHTIEVTRKKGAFGCGSLRAALDRSPVWGANHVEDSCNLLGTPLRLSDYLTGVLDKERKGW